MLWRTNILSCLQGTPPSGTARLKRTGRQHDVFCTLLLSLAPQARLLLCPKQRREEWSQLGGLWVQCLLWVLWRETAPDTGSVHE